jgi:DNA-binding MarR family transcriptional regulator
MFLAISKLDRDGSDIILEELMELIHITGYSSYFSLIAQFSENIERFKLIKSNEFPLKLNDLLHSQPRLNIMTYLLFNPNTSFSILRKETGFSSGKLINHCNRLEEEGYILRSTDISSNGAVTLYNISNKGNSELQKYAHQLSKLTSYFA